MLSWELEAKRPDTNISNTMLELSFIMCSHTVQHPVSETHYFVVSDNQQCILPDCLYNHNLELIWYLRHERWNLLHQSLNTAFIASLKCNNIYKFDTCNHSVPMSVRSSTQDLSFRLQSYNDENLGKFWLATCFSCLQQGCFTPDGTCDYMYLTGIEWFLYGWETYRTAPWLC